MSDRFCIRGCTHQHWATCENTTPAELAVKAAADAAGEKYRAPCRGCAPSVCREGSLICDACFGRARHLLGDAFDILAQIRSQGDPLKSGWNWDRVVIAGSSPEPPAPIGEDVIDATVAVRAAIAYFAAGLSELSNDLVAMEWLGPLVLDRHPADEEGVRERWSIQDAADRWGAERGDVHRFPAGVRPNAPAGSFARADDEEAHAPVREWYDPLLTVRQAAKRVGVTEQAVRLWVSKGLLVPATKARGPRGSVLSYFYASKVDAVDTSLEEKRTRPKPSAATVTNHQNRSQDV
ncbi:hypothetical protein [uncultured Microbacterium sp.]|uniref:MerR family transcriptional regulator n=1 Tax=uncultured Microbacterium sp. TaxID=191216 RepID=UPI0025D17640|nr:hypothetical protein [uncultured Microbacterium sp.]